MFTLAKRAEDGTSPAPDVRSIQPLLNPLALLVGDAAWALVTDVRFIEAWRPLYDSCPHSTAFQSPSFVRTWYAVYRAQWEPVIVYVADARGLVGLWLLARHRDQGGLTHAGAHQAEYHTWLARPGMDDVFLGQAWAALEQRVQFNTFTLKYLPNAALAYKLLSVPGLERRIELRVCARPLARLDAEDIKASFAKKSNKSRFNRLKRLGSLEFRKLTAQAEFETVFEELVACYDFRQGAVNGVTPFREDPFKGDFHRALFEQAADITHLTVTYLNDRPIAALWGGVSHADVHLGMLIHSPLLAEHSPGKLHLMLLSEHLLSEGKGTLDLTPGGDPWKERFANAHDEVAEVLIHGSLWSRSKARVKDQLLRWGKGTLAHAGVTTTEARSFVRGARRVRLASLTKRGVEWIKSDRELRIYRSDRSHAQTFRHDPRVRCNDPADLLLFTPSDASLTRERFLSAALARLEEGESVYTVRIGERLAHCGWLVRNQAKSQLSEVDQCLDLPAGSSTLYDFFTHPDFRGRGLYRATLGHMLRDVFDDPSAQYAYICVLASNAPSRHVIEGMGFEYRRSLFWERRLGGVPQKWSSSDIAETDARALQTAPSDRPS
ncbi:MAG TPA: GNAT family N-acetyltransferase [Burkholderiales bacterium]|nr:GNAT family N-acetyltransferase [Burkholderiales bacterium]